MSIECYGDTYTPQCDICGEELPREYEYYDAVEAIKRNMCDKLADKLFDDGLVAFDLQDDPANGGRLYRGSVALLLPPGFGSQSQY